MTEKKYKVSRKTGHNTMSKLAIFAKKKNRNKTVNTKISPSWLKHQHIHISEHSPTTEDKINFGNIETDNEKIAIKRRKELYETKKAMLRSRY
jgi:hypothetical protein